jgi:ABC-2 type transport system ATP-binding protein
VLELQGLTRRYGEVVALDNLSFTVREGQMFGFVGPNGAGKTTTMRIVLGVLEPDRGEVRWRGRPVDAETRRRFGYMPEERGLYPKMRVRDQLDYFARLHGLSAADAARAADYWIERLGVAERAGDRVEQLSLGNQQRSSWPPPWSTTPRSWSWTSRSRAWTRSGSTCWPRCWPTGPPTASR